MAKNVPAGYDMREFPAFAVTVDIVILSVVDGMLLVLLIERKDKPFKKAWALPGGFKRPGGDARRGCSSRTARGDRRRGAQTPVAVRRLRRPEARPARQRRDGGLPRRDARGRRDRRRHRCVRGPTLAGVGSARRRPAAGVRPRARSSATLSTGPPPTSSHPTSPPRSSARPSPSPNCRACTKPCGTTNSTPPTSAAACRRRPPLRRRPHLLRPAAGVQRGPRLRRLAPGVEPVHRGRVLRLPAGVRVRDRPGWPPGAPGGSCLGSACCMS